MPYTADIAVSSLTRSEALRGGEALGKLANEHVEALRHASHAADCAPSAAVTQMEWERDVEWGMQELGSMAAGSQSHPANHGDAEGTGANWLPCAQQAQHAVGMPLPTCVSQMAMLLLPATASKCSRISCQMCASLIGAMDAVPVQGLRHKHHRRCTSLISPTMQLDLNLALRCRQ